MNKEILGKTLSSVEEIITQRGQTHGEPEENLLDIASMWSVYLDRPVSVQDVCAMMILVKTCRQKNCTAKVADNFLDILGYAAIAETLTQEKLSKSTYAIDVRFFTEAEAIRQKEDAEKYRANSDDDFADKLRKQMIIVGNKNHWSNREEHAKIHDIK